MPARTLTIFTVAIIGVGLWAVNRALAGIPEVVMLPGEAVIPARAEVTDFALRERED
jgi:hypothetical protein